VRAGDNSGRSNGFSREGEEEGDSARVPKICGCEDKFMCVGREPTPDEDGGVFGREDVGSLSVDVPVCVLDCILGCVVFGSRWDTMTPILCENMEEEAKTAEWNVL
jgi:hypothetical protein